MPQMSPMNWLIIMLLIMYLFIIIMMINYFNFIKFKINYNSKFMNKWIWKW